MQVLLLGTGAADGWPNAFCRCPSCLDARQHRVLRTPTAALVDGRLLLDCGPEVPRQALRAGGDLADITTVLVTHAHDDHLAPAFLMHRRWVTDRPLRVIGPTPVIARCREWLAPDQSEITLTEVTAGDRLDIDGYHVHVLPAAHEAFGEAVLYALGAADEQGARALLYATDTGPWLPPALELMSGWRFDIVLLEETFGDRVLLPEVHHGLTTFGDGVAALRRLGLVGDRTRVIAVHLSHDNPPLAELQRRLAEVGAEALPDLTTVVV